MKRLFLISVVFLLGFLAVSPALAELKIEQISDIGDFNDYVVGPGKEYLFMDPGQSVTRKISITNRFQTEKTFKLELEDFRGGTDGVSPIEFMGLLAGPYSLKDYLKPEVMEFVLQPGDRVTLPVTIVIPQDAVPGGLYGSVIVTTEDTIKPGEAPKEVIAGQLPVKSRIAVLYFIRVAGPVEEEGNLENFKTDKKIYWNTDKPVNFSYSFVNNGNIYLNPFGRLEITNLYGTVVDNVEVNSSYVLPSSTRNNVISWDKGLGIGRYKATLTLNRGYLEKEDVQDVQTITFWILPWKLIVGFVVGLFIFLVIVRAIRKWFKKNYQRRS
jgi:hypothetical protein